MENVIPKYVRPLPSIGDPINYPHYWDDAVDAFDEKKYRETITNVLSYMNSSLLKDTDVSGNFEIISMQGSAEIQIKVTAEKFSIKVPFLKITATTNKVALLRRVAEANFSSMRLAQIHLHGEELWFEYEMPIELVQPNKLYNVIRSIVVLADKYDDEFIANYKASFYKQPQYTPLKDSEKQAVWKQIADVFADYKNYMAFFKEKRWDDYQWDNIVISLLKISNMPYVNGKLRTDLIDEISMMFNGDIHYKRRMEKGTNYMNELVEKSQEEIMKNVYHANQFISLRWRSNPQIIADRLENNLERVKDYEKEDNNFALSYYLQFVLLKLIYDYNLDEKYKDAIETVLEDVSGLPPNESAPKLAKVYHALQSQSINKEEPKKKKGFFSSLFN